jgi:hypothetical protein
LQNSRSKSKLAIYSSDDDDFGTKTDLIGEYVGANAELTAWMTRAQLPWYNRC